ncbi:MAG: tetraacyldisaccharide 4'-kinase [Synergistaceae bacterium]|nr:tetraacyldisaccharide 4'-kinase [Synergistaceae bacterium]
MGIAQKVVDSYMSCVRGERRSLFWGALAPLGGLVRAVAAALDFLYRHGLQRVEEPPLPLVSVGNLTYGGTNKTPFVEMLARMMEERGVLPGIVSRGYTSRNPNVRVLRDGAGDRDTAGDEPLLLSRRLPHVPVAVAKRRIDGVRALAARDVELVIADDAFQHRALGRDVDITLIDAACPFGNGRLVPAGILREPVERLSRAGLVVLTKADQVSVDSLAALKERVERFIPKEQIFTSRLEIDGWARWDGALRPSEPPEKGAKILAFSAIGNPESFIRSLGDAGLSIVRERRFKDHHRYSAKELAGLCSEAGAVGAGALVCTEKDLYNLPQDWTPGRPLWVPLVTAVLDEPERFFEALTETLRPRLVVASNGYGEDAIGVLLAQRLRKRFPDAEVLAFPLVGRGDAYAAAGFPVRSAPSVTPSGGVVKYRLRDLWGDMRAGLLRHVSAQLQDWKELARSVRTPLCVGDVYLLLHTLWGSGARPLFVATAKTVHLSGHWRLERFLIRRFTLRTWTRDEGTAAQINAGGNNNVQPPALYSGNPIMDLLGDADMGPAPIPPDAGDVPLILLLPGSRPRAYQDVNLLLDAALLLNEKRRCAFRMVLAPTLSLEKLAEACAGWSLVQDGEVACIVREGVSVPLLDVPVATAARGVSLLLGLGGTANQLCAGLGIPVVSIDEKGKRVQKKLLGDAEILVPPTAECLAEGALRVLGDPTLYAAMGAAGRERMGRPGALKAVVEYAARDLGWEMRENVYHKLKKYGIL